MIAHLTMRTHGVNQAFRFVTFGYIERVFKSNFFWNRPILRPNPALSKKTSEQVKDHENHIELEPGIPGGAEVVVPERQLLPVHPDHVVVSN